MEKKYQTVINFVKCEIDKKGGSPGKKLPSIKEMSQKMQCNKSTVIRAYNELEKEHMIYAVPKSGYYLVSKNKLPDSLLETDEIDFCSYLPNDKVIPDIGMHHCLNQSLEMNGSRMPSDKDLHGIVSLRKTIQKQLQDLQVFTSHDNILITTGSQQILLILARIAFPNGKSKILVEQPTNPQILEALEFSNSVTIGIERGVDGFDLEELETIFKSEDIKLFYLMPRFHIPTGYSLSQEQKIKIIDLAKKYDVYIVEDDCLGELELNSKISPIFSYDSSSKVIFIKSYSKILFPWLRLGIVVYPASLNDLFNGIRICSDIIEQGALELYIKNGMYSKQIKKTRNIYRDRMTALKNSCDKYLPYMVKTHIPDTGCYACIELPPDAKTEIVIHALSSKNMKVSDARNAFLPCYTIKNYLCFCIRNVGEDKIEQGIKIISEELLKLKTADYSNVG